MSFISPGGASKWSQITIDADKDMGGFGLSDLKQVAAAMAGGDLIVKGLGGILVRIPAGIANTVLTSAGPGALPTWAAGGLYLNRYFPANINLSVPTVAKNTARSHMQNNSMTNKILSAYVVDVGEDLPNLIKLLTPAITLPVSRAKNTTRSHTQTKTGAMATHADLGLTVTGAVSYLGGSFTTETTAAQNTTVNDMHLMNSPTPAVGDYYAFAYGSTFDFLTLLLGTQGAGVWVITWEYYNTDTTWHALASVIDGTNNFTNAAGTYVISFTNPGAAWATTTLNGVGPYYWIRARVSNYTSKVTIPLGTQAYASVKNAI